MMLRRAPALAAALLLAAGACSFDDGGLGPADGLRLLVDSDPRGARILVDGRETGHFTPDTVNGLGSRHQVQARLDTLGVPYRYLANVAIPDQEEVPVLFGPLVFRCGETACYEARHRYHSTTSLRFATNPVGAQFLHDASGDGLLFPTGTANSYASAGMPVFGALIGMDTVALGIYDQPFLAGRPASVVTERDGRVHVDQTTWVIPLPQYLTLSRSTARGVSIRQEIVAEDATEGVVVLRLTFGNVTHLESYRRMDPGVPADGITLEKMFVGYALDGDIGNPEDDVLTYDPELRAAILYDGGFSESAFGAGWANRPALLGLRMLAYPYGSRVVLNGYPRAVGDWGAARSNEPWGWYMLSGVRPFSPDHPDLGIGYLPAAPSDMRMTVSAGPFTLAPGDSVSITVAVAVAEPTPGTFTSGGAYMPPGEPHDATRPIYGVAATLRGRLVAAEQVAIETPPPPAPPTTGG